MTTALALSVRSQAIWAPSPNGSFWPKRVVKLAFEPRGSTPEELSAFVKEQLEV